MIRLARLAAVLGIAATAGCTTLQHTDPADLDAIYLTGSAGAGDIRACGLQYRRLEAHGKPVIWDGPMVSCDAFYAPTVVVRTGGCYTDRATWHPHAASAFGLFPHRGATDFLVKLLPEPLRSVFLGSWHYYDHITIAIYGNAELRAIWPEFACDRKDT